ncbi:hypothetical protein BT69DRAFT_1224570 [Atractiella rhizophila]|nr:hypothetical protein BT69DRAFT_1224570 [Atractiella rhizophila]
MPHYGSCSVFCFLCSLGTSLLCGKLLRLLLTVPAFVAPCASYTKDIDRLDIERWEPQTKEEHLVGADLWHKAQTHKQREATFRKYGVRYSVLNLLRYRDPVRHTVLGVMRNVCEGLLQNHFRRQWGINAIMKQKGSNAGANTELPPPLGSDEDDDISLDDDDLDMTAEVAALEEEREEAALANAGPPVDLAAERSRYQHTVDANYDVSCIFQRAEFSRLRESMDEVQVPSWVERLPSDLGYASTGRLKADAWFNLYTIFLLLTLGTLWLQDSSNERNTALFDNFANLVTAANIAGAYSVTVIEADQYLRAYKAFRQGLKALFPHSKAVPNHHFAMHIAELLQYWGPLMYVSEWPGERVIGTLESH